MPCIIKQQTTTSPGIITFTHNEVLWGLPKNSKKVRNYLVNSHKEGKWIFGVHIQGDCSFLSSWPLEPWQSFVMWPDKNVSFLQNVPKKKLCPFTCINFMPEYLSERNEVKKIWDICVISRASTIKRIDNTLIMLREILKRRPETKIIVIVPDSRHLMLGEKAYKKQAIDESYFKLPQKLFSARELKQISFISSSQDSFGNFPLAGELVADILEKSKFLLLNSHKEGVPRVIAESLMLGTPCIVSDKLNSGLNNWLNKDNSISIPDEPVLAVNKIFEGLRNYERFKIDKNVVRNYFSESKNIENYKNYLSSLIKENNQDVNGIWYLEDLHLRLACHGQKKYYQFFNNEKIFFSWIKQLEKLKETFADEDLLYCNHSYSDQIPLFRKYQLNIFSLIKKIIKKIIFLISN